MAKVKIQGNASGTGVFTITPPATSTDRTLTLPDATGTILMTDGDGSSLTGITHTPADNSVTLAKMAHGTDGELITYDAAGAPANVAVGTSGHILTSGGVGVAPTFQAAAAGGADTALSNLTSTGEQRVCQAWVNFNGIGTVSIHDSYNVSSITDSGTGTYIINFNTAMANSNYSLSTASIHYDSGNEGMVVCESYRQRSTSGIAIDAGCPGTSGVAAINLRDMDRISAQVFGD